MADQETYLGDGLYASFDGFQFKLRAPRGIGLDISDMHADHEVYLEPAVVKKFQEYVQETARKFTGVS